VKVVNVSAICPPPPLPKCRRKLRSHREKLQELPFFEKVQTIQARVHAMQVTSRIRPAKGRDLFAMS